MTIQSAALAALSKQCKTTALDAPMASRERAALYRIADELDALLTPSTPTPTPETVNRSAVIELLKRADKEIGDAVQRQWNGGHALQMSIPARPDRDSDLIIAGALQAAIKALESTPTDAPASRTLEALRQLHLECLDEGHTDSGDMGDVCQQRGMVIRCGICVALKDAKNVLQERADLRRPAATEAAPVGSESARQSTPATPPHTEQTQHWSVSVHRNGEQVVTIESNCLSGREISEADAEVIRTCAEHLRSFVGESTPHTEDDK